ncbi:MAG: hypothetical protein ACXWAV_01630 [Chthoniobacterales bacterium]
MTTGVLMKKTILLSSLAVFALTFDAAGQGEAARVDAARAAIDTTREYRGDRDFRNDREVGRNRARAQYEIDALNRDVRKLREEMRGIRSERIRGRFDRLVRDTDRLTALFRQERLHSSEARHRAEDLQGDAARLRAMIRDYRR